VHRIIVRLYQSFSYLQESDALSEEQKSFYNHISRGDGRQVEIEDSLQVLTEYLFAHHGKQPLILIDEYDTPIHAGYLNGFYDKIISFFRNFLSAGLKDNPCLYKAVLTGILRVSRESLFSGLNHLKVYSVLNSKFSSYFGFTEREVEDLLMQAHMDKKIIDVKNWYNGYHMADVMVYNPWSILNFIQEGGVLQPYWVNTSDNELIKSLLSGSSFSIKDDFEKLLQGNSLEKFIDENVMFSDLKKNNPTSIWSLFLMTGYLTAMGRQLTEGGSLCSLAIPNKEVSFLFKKIIKEWFVQDYGLEWYTQFLNALLTGDMERFSAELKELIDHTVSVHDTGRSPEVFYHGLMIGLTASLHGSPLYEIRSNRESGKGRYDYAIIAREPQTLSILMEFKRVQEEEGRTFSSHEMTNFLKQEAQEALTQMTQKAYYAEIKQRGLTRLLKIGLAFSGKKFCLLHEVSNI
ncbi:MAG: AAA family ATPase, partial [Proteobacteria bacterium]|nr:AAA family ATPase [Pseudomonadota bacterium]